MYLTAVFFESVRRSSGGLTKTHTLAASVPVNLRQFFPSTSPRDFFATIRVEHTYGAGTDDLGSICRQLESQFRPKSTREALEKKLRRFLRLDAVHLADHCDRSGPGLTERVQSAESRSKKMATRDTATRLRSPDHDCCRDYRHCRGSRSIVLG
jgi:hypothetical protein